MSKTNSTRRAFLNLDDQFTKAHALAALDQKPDWAVEDHSDFGGSTDSAGRVSVGWGNEVLKDNQLHATIWQDDWMHLESKLLEHGAPALNVWFGDADRVQFPSPADATHAAIELLIASEGFRATLEPETYELERYVDEFSGPERFQDITVPCPVAAADSFPGATVTVYDEGHPEGAAGPTLWPGNLVGELSIDQAKVLIGHLAHLIHVAELHRVGGNAS